MIAYWPSKYEIRGYTLLGCIARFCCSVALSGRAVTWASFFWPRSVFMAAIQGRLAKSHNRAATTAAARVPHIGQCAVGSAFSGDGASPQFVMNGIICAIPSFHPVGQTQVKKANLRFRMIWALPGMGGELINFDTIMTMLAVARIRELEIPQGTPCRDGGAESALLTRFQNLSIRASNLHSKRIDPLQFREALAAEHRYMLKLHEDLLAPEYVQRMMDRGTFE